MTLLHAHMFAAGMCMVGRGRASCPNSLTPSIIVDFEV